MSANTARWAFILVLLLPLVAHGRKLTDADHKQLPSELGDKVFKLDRKQSFVVDLAPKRAIFVSGTALTGKHKGKLRVLLVAKRKVLADISAKWTVLNLAKAKLRTVTFRDLDGDGSKDVALILRVTATKGRKTKGRKTKGRKTKGRKTMDHAYCYGWESKALKELHSDSGRRLRLGHVVAQVQCEYACTSYGSCDEEVNGGMWKHGDACTDVCLKKKPKVRRRWLECVFGSSCKHVVTKC